MLVLNLSPAGPSTSPGLQGNQLRPHPCPLGAQEGPSQASISTSPSSACCMPGPALERVGNVSMGTRIERRLGICKEEIGVTLIYL